MPRCQSSSRMASLSQGLRPITNGAMALRASSTDSTFAPLELSPQPSNPSSVEALTTTSVTPSRLTSELASRCVYGMLAGMNSSLAIFMLERIWAIRYDTPSAQSPMTGSNSRGASQVAVIGLMFAFSVMSYFERTIMTIAGPEIMKEFNISATSMGSVYSAFILSYAILMTPAGWAADRLGPRLTLFLMGM